MKILSNIEKEIEEIIQDVFVKNLNTFTELANKDYEEILNQFFNLEEITNFFENSKNSLDAFIVNLNSKLDKTFNSTSTIVKELQDLIQQNMKYLIEFNINLLTFEKLNLQFLNELKFLETCNNKIFDFLNHMQNKAIIVGIDFINLIEKAVRESKDFVQKIEGNLFNLFTSIKDKISQVDSEIDIFKEIFTNKFTLDYFNANTLKRRNLFFKPSDIFNAIIKGIKDFENYHEIVKGFFINAEITHDIESHISQHSSLISKGIRLPVEISNQLFKSIEDIFDPEGILIFEDIINTKISKEVKSEISNEIMNVIKDSLIAFRQIYNFSFDKINNLGNYFTNIIDAAKYKIPSLVNFDGLDFNHQFDPITKGPSFKKPIPVLYFILWLHADFKIKLNMSIFAKANIYEIDIGFNTNTNSYMNAGAYIDLYIIRSGVSATANLVDLNNDTSVNYKLLDLSGNFKSCGTARFLNVDVGIWVSHLVIIFRWRCWRVWFFKICILWIEIRFSNPIYLIRYISPWAFDRNFCFWDISF